MKGIVLNFNSQDNLGLIRCTSDNRYEFSLAQWRSSSIPLAGDSVDFIEAERKATEIYKVEDNSHGQQIKSKTISSGTKTSTLSIISLIAGVLGIFLFGSIIAIICGHIACSEIRNSNGKLSGNGLAISGLILGYLGIAFWGVWVLVSMLMVR